MLRRRKPLSQISTTALGANLKAFLSKGRSNSYRYRIRKIRLHRNRWPYGGSFREVQTPLGLTNICSLQLMIYKDEQQESPPTGWMATHCTNYAQVEVYVVILCRFIFA